MGGIDIYKNFGFGGRDEYFNKIKTIRKKIDDFNRVNSAVPEEEVIPEAIPEEEAVFEPERGVDTWGIVMVMCVAAALIILIKD